MRFIRKKSRCDDCPLQGRQKVASKCDVEKPVLAIIGEAPGKDEEIQKEPFVGAAGGCLKRAVAGAGLMWHSVYRLNVISCRPTNNDITTSEAQEAIECCKPGFDEELDFIQRLGVRVVVPAGNTALSAMKVPGNISKVRGSIYYDEKRKWATIPTYHPSFILRGAYSEEPTWIADIRKAKELSFKKYVPPKEKFNLFPTVNEVEDYVGNILKKDLLVGVDIETTGLNPFYARILMIGLAISGEEALVVPFAKKGGSPYWSNTDKKRVDVALKKLFLKARLMFQNAMFDVRHLEYAGYKCNRIEHDTMLCHHAIHPELPHNLGYIVSIYGTTPFWKDVVLNNPEHMLNMDDTEVRTYNARDSVVLHQILPGLLEDLKEGNTERQYFEWSMGLLRPLIDTTMYGIGIDQKKLKTLAAQLKRDRDKLYDELFAEFDLPEGFNFDSVDHVRFLLYGTKPKSYDKVLAELENHEAAGKRTDTKKYKELAARAAVFRGIKPLYKTYARVNSTDADSLVSIARAASGRLEALGELVRRKPEHNTEEKAIRKLLHFIKLFSDFSEVDKALSTYTKYPIGPDGRVHGEYKIHGTATGRLSASNPNMQNQPKSVRIVFTAGPERTLVQADYSNLELRLLAYITGEPYLIDAFAKGLNIHDVNCMALWGITKEDPRWDELRRAAKTYVFGRNYGGTVEGIYRRLVAAQPELGLTISRFTAMDKAYFDKMPKYKAWREAVQKEARETRISVNIFGRRRLFMGMPEEIEREALNTPVQGGAGDIANAALIRIAKIFRERPDLDAHIVVTVHDSIVSDCPETKRVEVAEIMKREMEKPVRIEGIDRVFPVDLESGQCWGKLEKLELEETPCRKKATTGKTASRSPTTKTKSETKSGSKTSMKTRSRKVKDS
jgi:uracil-DNA glycosylase family 4